MDVMDKRMFAKFEFKMRFWEIYSIVTAHAGSAAGYGSIIMCSVISDIDMLLLMQTLLYHY